MAQELFRQISNKHETLSAGTKVVGSEGENLHGQMIKDLPAGETVVLVLKEKGIDALNNKRTQLDPNLVDWADKIIVMAERESVPDYL